MTSGANMEKDVLVKAEVALRLERQLKARVRAREKEFVVETLAGIATGDIRLAAAAG